MATLTPELTTGGVEVEDATGWLIRESITAHLSAGALPGIPRFEHRAKPNLRGLQFPIGIVSRAPVAFNVNPQAPVGKVTNRYGVAIVIARSSQQPTDGSSAHDRQTDVWLERTARRFNHTRPSWLQVPDGVCLEFCEVPTAQARYAPAWVKQLDAVYLIVHVPVREAIYRG